MWKRWLLPVLLLVAACVLHLPAHLGDRAPLPQDNPALLANPALRTTATRSLGTTLGEAMSDPDAAWANAGDTVGRTRWRPVSTAFAVVELEVLGDGAGRGVAAVSLLLHVLVAWQTVLLVRALGEDPRAGIAAGLLALAAPIALAVVDWPARQSVVLAAALGMAGLRSAACGTRRAAFAGGVLLALAGLAHEAAFALLLAVPFVRSLVPSGVASGVATDDGRPGPLGAAARSAWPALLAPVVAIGLVARAVIAQGGTPAVLGGALGLLAGAAAALQAFVGFVLPARFDLAAGGWTESVGAGLVGCVALVAVATACWRATSATAARSARLVLAGFAALASLPLAGVIGAGRPDVAAAYLATPLLAAAVGCAAGAAASRRPVQPAGVAACALLLGASVAGTLTRARAFRDPNAFVALAAREAPSSSMTAAWRLVERLRSVDPADRTTQLAALVGPAVELAERVETGAGEQTRAGALRMSGAIEAVTIGSSLAEAAAAFASALPVGDGALDRAVDVARAAAGVIPERHETWIAVALTEHRRGALRAALDACIEAVRLAPDDLFAIEVTGNVSLDLGHTTVADQFAAVVSASGRPTRELPVSFRIVWVRALLADGARKVLTTTGSWIWRYDEALQLLLELDAADLTPAQRATADRLLLRTYLQWGDLLVELDRTALARLAYGAGVKRFPKSGDMREHLSWLDARLAREEADAKRALYDAQRGHGNIANALAALGVAFCRQGNFKEADEVFRSIESQIGGANPPLRLQIATHRYAALPSVPDLTRARVELERVLREAPELARARLELARVLEALGDLPAAHRTYLQAAEEGVTEEWGLDALEAAEELDAFFPRTPPGAR